MSKLKSFSRIRGKECIVHKVVYELRYHHGLTYLDRCGRTVNLITKEYPEWTLLSEQPNPQNAPLVSIVNSCQFNFNARKLDLSLERPLGQDPLTPGDVEQFAEQTEAITSIVIDQLGVTDFSRVGFRIWLLFSMSSKDESEAWLKSLGCFRVDESLAAGFNGTHEATTVAIVVRSDDRMYRVAFSGVERQAQLKVGDSILNLRPRDLPKDQRKVLLEQEKVRRQIVRSPEHAAMIDIDVYQEDLSDVKPKSLWDRVTKVSLQTSRRHWTNERRIHR